MSRATYKQRIEMFLSMSTLKGTFDIVTIQLASFNIATKSVRKQFIDTSVYSYKKSRLLSLLFTLNYFVSGTITSSIKPYSLASSAVKKLSRSVSFCIFSIL